MTGTYLAHHQGSMLAAASKAQMAKGWPRGHDPETATEIWAEKMGLRKYPSLVSRKDRSQNWSGAKRLSAKESENARDSAI